MLALQTVMVLFEEFSTPTNARTQRLQLHSMYRDHRVSRGCRVIRESKANQDSKGNQVNPAD